MPRTIATVDISLQFEVKMEIQRYKELLSMLADWGCMATFLFAFFGVPGLYINALRFKLQLKGVDLRQVSGDQFNAHGGLKAPNLRLPTEVQGYADDDNWQLAILSAEETAEAAKLKAEPRVQKQEFA